MVMRPAPPETRVVPRRGLRCLLGFHTRNHWRLRAEGEHWGVFLFVCTRCHRMLDGSHAFDGDEPCNK